MIYNKIEHLYDMFDEKIKDDNEHDKCVDDVFESQTDILTFLRETVSGLIHNPKLFEKAVNGMENINNYCDKYGCERVFDFDKSDIRTVVRCASRLNSSISDFSVDYLM